MNEQTLLPPGFEDLNPYLDWALPTESARSRKRLGSSMEEMQKFYDAMLTRVDDILEHLGASALEAMPPAQQNLFNLCLSLSEVSFAVEVYGQPEVPNSMQELGEAERFVIVHD